MKQIILHIPHSSVNIPFKHGYITNDKILADEILKLTDWYTDDLFHSDKDLIIKADFSRIFCDVERFIDDEHEPMSQFGMGVLYVKSDDGKIIRNLTTDLRKRILNDYYWLHHRYLGMAVKNQLDKHKKAVIIDCHSFPHIPLNSSLNKDAYRPDFNLGTDPFHSPQKLIDLSVDFFNKKGYTLGINRPYNGTIVPLEYYQKNKNVNSMMLEVNRKLYLNGLTNEKSKNYSEIKMLIQEYIKEIKNCI
ncbi:MAG: N-formylglutamate amidohydrolase [Bacteroidia bacterium]